MDATTTHSMSLLIQKLKAAHPTLSFEEAEHFAWSPSKQTIFYTPALPNAPGLLLHELSHALLGHEKYRRDVELIAMETAAWEKAKDYTLTTPDLLPNVSAELNDDIIQDHLDTYRDWLHARSTCPNCSATGYQSDTNTYTCPACSQTWRVNEARLCALRRYTN